MPWPEAAHYPPPQPPGQAADRPDHPAGPEPLFPPAAPPTPGPKGPRSWSGRLRTLPARTWRGRADDPGWVRPALLGLLLATAALYGWNLTASGWANSFYSAAVQAGTQSWQAFFYGSSDAANFITVDKPPMSLWPMELTARLFGLSSFTVLAPEVLMGVATVGGLYATVRRRFSPLAGLLAGAALALTPVAALMFRFNNPDALLVLLLTLAAYAFVRATESASTRWLLLAGVMFGFGFLTKTLQAFLILPAFALVYLVVAPTGLWRRLRQLLAAGLALVLAGGWWVAVVQLVPAADRPYVGGSQDDSFLSLTFGYNGFGRLTGNETGSVGGGAAAPGGGGGAGGGGGPHWGSTGLTRLFGSDLGGQIGWLLPAALVLLLLGLWATRRAARTDAARTAFLVWGGWLLSTGLTFSYMSGIFHQYYTVALAPAVAALVGMGVDGLWRPAGGCRTRRCSPCWSAARHSGRTCCSGAAPVSCRGCAGRCCSAVWGRRSCCWRPGGWRAGRRLGGRRWRACSRWRRGSADRRRTPSTRWRARTPARSRRRGRRWRAAASRAAAGPAAAPPAGRAAPSRAVGSPAAPAARSRAGVRRAAVPRAARPPAASPAAADRPVRAAAPAVAAAVWAA